MSALPPKVQPKPGQVKVFRALYNYTAQQPDELSFKAGDILYVYDQTSDKDWWKARIGDKDLIIPSNYVELHTETVNGPLHEAARRGNVSFLRECLQQGVSATGLDSVGNTPLHWASRGGHAACVKELLALGTPPLNVQNKMGDTPLHLAAAHNHLEALNLLLSAGANCDIKNADGQTPDQLGDVAVSSSVQLSRLTERSLAELRTLQSYRPEDYLDDSD